MSAYWMRPDILIRNSDGQLISVVEIKNRQGLSSDVATQLRRNMVVHQALPPTRYFLLLSQDMGYLWQDSADQRPDIPPALELPVKDIIRNYLQQSPWRHDPERWLPSSEFELLIFHWLQDLVSSASPSLPQLEQSPVFMQFQEAIRGGILTTEEPA